MQLSVILQLKIANCVWAVTQDKYQEARQSRERGESVIKWVRERDTKWQKSCKIWLVSLRRQKLFSHIHQPLILYLPVTLQTSWIEMRLWDFFPSHRNNGADSWLIENETTTQIMKHTSQVGPLLRWVFIPVHTLTHTHLCMLPSLRATCQWLQRMLACWTTHSHDCQRCQREFVTQRFHIFKMFHLRTFGVHTMPAMVDRMEWGTFSRRMDKLLVFSHSHTILLFYLILEKAPFVRE